jgi:hypothetical protein
MGESGFIVMTPLGLRVICTAGDWERIAGIQHLPIRGRFFEVTRALTDPDGIRRSRSDPQVILFHLRSGSRWVCAVVCRDHPAFRLISAYPADKMKPGKLLWKK